MRSKSRVKGALKEHKDKPLTRIKLMQLKKKYPNRSEDYWKGYFDGVSWAYEWVLEK